MGAKEAGISLRQAADMLGVSKTSARKYLDLPDDPLPYEMRGGAYCILPSDIRAFKERHPEIASRSFALRNVDRQPVSGTKHAKPLITVAEAAAATGFSVSGIRNMIRHPHHPLPVEKNEGGWVLIDQDVLGAYIETRGANPDEDGTATVDIAGYPELGRLQGTYQAPSKIADALGLPRTLVYEWLKDPIDPPPHIMSGKKYLINKNKMASWLDAKEGQPASTTPA